MSQAIENEEVTERTDSHIDDTSKHLFVRTIENANRHARGPIERHHLSGSHSAPGQHHPAQGSERPNTSVQSVFLVAAF